MVDIHQNYDLILLLVIVSLLLLYLCSFLAVVFSFIAYPKMPGLFKLIEG